MSKRTQHNLKHYGSVPSSNVTLLAEQYNSQHLWNTGIRQLNPLLPAFFLNNFLFLVHFIAIFIITV